MDASRRSASNASPARATQSVQEALARALDGRPNGRVLIVAFSGGLDSTVLLHGLRALCSPTVLRAVHVHHGLQPAADDWLRHCERTSWQWGVAFDGITVTGRPDAGCNVEAWAREVRYDALCRVARREGAEGVLTAHHADDQLETVLMRLARGAGLAGLGGIAAAGQRDGVALLRPLLGLPRAALHEYARHHALTWVEDPSNADTRLVRNAVRRQVVPALDGALPGLRAALHRNIDHWREAAAVLDELARSDLAPARVPGSRWPVLDRRPLLAVTPARRHWALRCWLEELGLRMPGTARFEQMARQLLDGASAHGRVDHQGTALMRYRDSIIALPVALLAGTGRASGPADGHESASAPADGHESAQADGAPQAQGRAGESAGRPSRDLAEGLAEVPADASATSTRRRLLWRGESQLSLGPGRGTLHFERVAPGSRGEGLAAAALQAQPLRVLHEPAGALRLRMRPDGPSRTLKQWYQTLGVPAWARWWMPVVLVDDRVCFSGAFGPDRSRDWYGAEDPGARVVLRWEPPADLCGPLSACGHPWGLPYNGGFCPA